MNSLIKNGKITSYEYPTLYRIFITIPRFLGEFNLIEKTKEYIGEMELDNIRSPGFFNYIQEPENDKFLRECTDNRYLSSEKKDFYFPCTLKSENEKMETFYMILYNIPTIIDYGRSNIK